MTLTGAEAPARHPVVAEALTDGAISVAAAAAIVGLLDRVAFRSSHEVLTEAERSLVGQASGLSLNHLQKILQRAEAWLDPDGVEPREDELRFIRSVQIREERDGMVVLTAKLDPRLRPQSRPPSKPIVGAELRHREAEVSPMRTRRIGDPSHRLQADALATICRHVLGCDAADAPTAGATVVVRVGLEALESGTGFGTIDGLIQPVSVATIRRMAAGGKIIPCVLDGDGEILDFGRSRRLFSPAQKLALVERDGGCAMCGLPPGMTQVHHIRWWERDAGPTDLANGILLCVRCHHRIHDDGWEIRIDGVPGASVSRVGVRSRVSFIPPAHVDRDRVPRLGGRARFDYLAA